MTRKDYVLIANTFHKWAIKSWLTKDDSRLIETLVIDLGKSLKEDNPRFDIAKFHDAVFAERIADAVED